MAQAAAPVCDARPESLGVGVRQQRARQQRVRLGPQPQPTLCRHQRQHAAHLRRRPLRILRPWSGMTTALSAGAALDASTIFTYLFRFSLRLPRFVPSDTVADKVLPGGL
jgi:hypothetical protein